LFRFLVETLLVPIKMWRSRAHWDWAVGTAAPRGLFMGCSAQPCGGQDWAPGVCA